MEAVCEVTFCELRCKEIINVIDGKRLGRIIDLVFDLKCGRILGLVAPGFRRFIGFKSREDIYIPWRSVCKIGDDVILVELRPSCPPEPLVATAAAGGRRYSAEYEGAETIKVQSAPQPAPQGKARYEQYYDVYDVKEGADK